MVWGRGGVYGDTPKGVAPPPPPLPYEKETQKLDYLASWLSSAGGVTITQVTVMAVQEGEMMLMVQ